MRERVPDKGQEMKKQTDQRQWTEQNKAEERTEEEDKMDVDKAHAFRRRRDVARAHVPQAKKRDTKPTHGGNTSPGRNENRLSERRDVAKTNAPGDGTLTGRGQGFQCVLGCRGFVSGFRVLVGIEAWPLCFFCGWGGGFSDLGTYRPSHALLAKPS